MQLDYSIEKQRRIAQFARSLKPMHRRTVKLVRDCCFAIIEERYDDWMFSQSLSAARSQATSKVAAPALATCGGQLDSHGIERAVLADDRLVVEGWSADGWRGDNRSNRFIQFVFLERHFEMDLPRPMLWPEEAKQILRDRSGFQFMRESQSGKNRSTIATFQPLRKPYIHGDVTTAAEDVAWIFFELWRFPVDSKLFLTTFGGNYQWESGMPLV